jgi:hypothetical protein
MFALLILCLLTGCSSVRYIKIETYRPSEVTYPEQVRKVLIVNNALPQPPDRGYEFKLSGVLQDTCRANADSAIFDACRALGHALVETNYFDDVLLFQEATRKDAAFYLDTKLSPEEVTALCDETGADALISFDRLLFDMKKTVTGLGGWAVVGSIDLKIQGVVRAYLPGRTRPELSLMVSDSLYFMEEAVSPDLLNLPPPDEALRVAGDYVGAKIHTAFVPHWSEDIRWFFTASGARWKEATAYASGEKWKEAAERWQWLYERSSRTTRAKAASNLALASELSEDMEQALAWAKISYDLFRQSKGENHVYTKSLQFYAETLEKRIVDERKLNLQFGEE